MEPDSEHTPSPADIRKSVIEWLKRFDGVSLVLACVRAHRFFMTIQFVALLSAAYWWRHPSAPGYAIGVMAVGAAVMSLLENKQPCQIAAWCLFMGAFLLVEFRAIAKNESAQRCAREQENAQFKAIADGITDAWNENQRQFSETMNKANKILGGVQENLEAVTGAKTFAEFLVAPNMGSGNPKTYPLTVFVFGKYPMRSVTAQIQKLEEANDPASLARQFQSMHTVPLGDGTILPTPHSTGERLSLGRYVITTWSIGGYSNE